MQELSREGADGRRRRRDLRLPARLQGPHGRADAAHRPEERRRLHVRHDRPGGDPLPHRDLGAGQLLYVVGAPQRLHFELVFAAARMAGWLNDEVDVAPCRPSARCSARTARCCARGAGRPVTLAALLHEAVERAGALLAERGVPEGADPPALARAIGIGAVKYADLSTDRERDYVFSFDRMLSLDGNTSVYLQYANARGRSVLARAGTRRRRGVHARRAGRARAGAQAAAVPRHVAGRAVGHEAAQALHLPVRHGGRLLEFWDQLPGPAAPTGARARAWGCPS